MENKSHCPNCNTKLKGILSEIRLLNEIEMKFVKDFGKFNGDILCQKCSKGIIKSSQNKYISENNSMKAFLKEYSSSFPIVTLQNPKNWQYETLGIVTSQATMENKVENKSLLDFLLGVNENLVDLNSSVNVGESICIETVRQKTYLLGGNAILGVDIDYSEFGLKGELMLVCMAGTAVKIKNLDQFSEKYSTLRIRYDEVEPRLSLLKKHRQIAAKL